MPICSPRDPAFHSEAEREVWQALREQLPVDAHLLANVTFTGERDYECDLIVLWPDVGACVLEVKGGHVTFRDGVWTQSDATGSRPIDPIGQVQANRHALKKYIEQRWSGGALSPAWLLVLPHSSLPAGMDLPAAPRERIVDLVGMPTLADRIHALLAGSAATPLAAARCRLVTDHLTGRFEPQADLVAEGGSRAEEVRRLTEQQFSVLSMLRRAPRFAVFGPAGSGKTFIAMEQARRLAADGKRVAILCYSRGLSRFIRRASDALPERQRPAFVGTFHQWGWRLGLQLPATPTSQWWETESAQEMLAAVRALEAERRFDAIIVDEAQDFGVPWWPVVIASLRDEVNGELVVFADEDQEVFERGESALPELTPIVLDLNVRNAKPIATAADALASDPVRHLGIDGPRIDVHDVPYDQAVSTADDLIDPLLDEGWSPGDIVLITTGSRHPEQVLRAESGPSAGSDAYWDSFWDDADVFYGHVLSFKGLERPVVVLAINDWKHPERARELLYVGLTRARDRLVICGPVDDLRRIGGDDLLRALGS